jgi:UPF0042 nucleotide-binding protein
MRIVIITGRSGSGKTTALQTLEDQDYYCIDNLPANLLPALAKDLLQELPEGKSGIAISIDARNTLLGLQQFPQIIRSLDKTAISYDIIYLDASSPTLLKRFSATRRKHPLTRDGLSLKDAIGREKQILAPMSKLADLKVDTSNLTLYELRDIIKTRVSSRSSQTISLLFQSFGFKHGVPVDADMVYDARCLPNPYWEPELRELTGLDAPVIQYLQGQDSVRAMLNDIIVYLQKWLPYFENNNRSYLTVSIGCTGGQHRSVFLTEALSGHFGHTVDNVLVKHRELVYQESP